jgi:uncharacterized protein (DUF488 family)
MKDELYTIGHSTHAVADFLALLNLHRIGVVADVRSMPYSRFTPQFNREDLRQTLRQAEIAYVFMGKEFGARSDDPGCYVDGKVQYESLVATADFQSGVIRIKDGLDNGHRIALMCAEKDPLDCHRTILVANSLETEEMGVTHILADGRLETQHEAMVRLISKFNLPEDDLFLSPLDVIQKALKLQEERIAYVEQNGDRQILAEG